jgi:hypothetical protein
VATPNSARTQAPGMPIPVPNGTSLFTAYPKCTPHA